MKRRLVIIVGSLVWQTIFGQNIHSYFGDKPVVLAEYQIIKPVSATPAESMAAGELQKYIHKITRIELPVFTDKEKKGDFEFVIGMTNRTPLPEKNYRFAPDEFHLFTENTSLYITGGNNKGCLYGVYEFLEKYAGCRFWTPQAEYIPDQKTIAVPKLDVRSKPAFQSREVYYAGMEDDDFAGKMRCDRHAWKGGENWGLWVHTMFRLVPPERYFAKHPEYYALMAGKRTTTQLCLTNPDVLRITIANLKKLIKKHPEKKYWSVSQMDNYGACECDACREIDEKEGSHSGTMISFVNKVASAFPGKVISTLAYQYTRQAPLHVKPAPNVNIMLCTIECDRSRPLETDTSAGSFVSDLRQWAAISKDILVWDYVIQFTNMIAPFPNLPVLQPNIQLFKKYGVNAVFEQGCHGTYSENQELRQYLLSKLLWNPDINVDSLTFEFLNGYYGPAAPYIHRYLDKMAVSLKKSGGLLWIYSSPMEETGSFLSPSDLSEYSRFFDLAENSVSAEPEYLKRVQMARLPLRYAILEIRKRYITGQDGFLEMKDGKMVIKQGTEQELDTLVNQSIRYGVKTYHEKKQDPEMYRKAALDFFYNAYRENLATGKPYDLSVQPARKYSADGAGSLTDGKRGSPNYYVLWQGFEGQDLSLTVDLGKPTVFNYAGMEFLQDLTSWIFMPERLKCSASLDNDQFSEIFVADSLSSSEPVTTMEVGKLIENQQARYVRFEITGQKICPGWHIGHGGKAWLFTDEIIIDKR